jgi:hypothetical protein
MARMEMGMAATITCPTLSPEYAEAMVNTTHRNSPHPMDRAVSSGGAWEAGTTG